MDDYDSFITEDVFTRSNRKVRYQTRPCSFPLYSDEELLSLPADQIIAERRLTALGGREYICGDNAPTNWAVVRIPMDEATTEDFRPRLDWKDHNEARAPMVGRYKINRSFANKGIAPRVAEPELPPQTKTSMYNASQENTPLQPIEKSMLKATQVIQLVKKANGDYRNLAKALGQMWGDENLLDPDEETDTLGMVSLPRVLAKRSKRRFEVYRNIGFTSIVSAGSTQASAKGYGDSSMINWQRRTELAKLFLHFAQALEGGELEVGQEFSIAARIPEFTVNHRTWDDLAISVSHEMTKINKAPIRYKQVASEFLSIGLQNALRIVSETVRAAGGSLEPSSQDLVVAAKYDRLTYYAPMQAELERKTLSSEIALSRRTESSLSIYGNFKAHDMRVAVLEIMASSDTHATEVSHALVAMKELANSDSYGPVLNTYGFYSSILRQLPIVSICSKLAANRPKEYELRHRKAEWTKICEYNVPRDLVIETDPYNAQTIALALLYAIHRDRTSQAHRTLLHLCAKSRDVLNHGIRAKKEIVIRYGDGVRNTIHSEIWAANRKFYRERYRHRARIAEMFAQMGANKKTRHRGLLGSAWWYARSDVAHGATLATTGGMTELTLSGRKERAVYAIYLHKLKSLTLHDAPKLNDMTIEEVRNHVDKIVGPIAEENDSAFYPLSLADRIADYLQVQQKDYGEAYIETVVESPGTPTGPTANASEIETLLDRPLPDMSKTLATIDSMVSHWYSIAEMGNYMDAEECEDLVEWMEDNMSLHVSGVDSYIETHAKGETRKSARALMDFWTDLKELDEEADAGRNEIY